jgi:hypothetical protein
MRSFCPTCLPLTAPPRLLRLLCVVMLGLLWAGGARADLVVNEALSAPSSDWNGDGVVDFKNDEWVEILNTGPGVESLDGVFLRDGTGTEYHYGFTGSLSPGEVRAVFGDESVAWQAAHGLATVGLSLNNGGDTVELWRDQTDPIVLQPLDVVPIPAHAAANERALGRDPVTLGWLLFDGLNPYTGALQPGYTGCSPSPGRTNECGPILPDGDVTWGSLKQVYAPPQP